MKTSLFTKKEEKEKIMKIGILTFHRVYNYGATLQAVALRLKLEEAGHQVSYIDYFPEYHRRTYRVFEVKSLKGKGLKAKIYGLYVKCRNRRGKKARKKAYDPFIQEHIVPYCKAGAGEHYDVIVYGSDQIWRKGSGNGKGAWFNPVYFGDNEYDAERHVSYAASMGTVDVDDSERAFLRRTLGKFGAVGVREKGLFDILKPLNLPHLHFTIDPTMLLKAEEWDAVLGTRRLIAEPYLLYYRLRDSFSDEDVRSFSKKKGCREVRVCSFDRASDSSCHPDPAEFVSLIKYADYVLTSSFHGLAFSLLYRKEVFVSISSNTQRLQGLLKMLGMEERFIPYGSPIPDGSPQIDYDEVHGRLEAFRRDSSDFLADAVESHASSTSFMQTPISM